MTEGSIRWYVIHTYSGYENAVRDNIKKLAEGRGMSDRIQKMEIPLELVTESKRVEDEDGKIQEVNRQVERKIYPGYVFIKMLLNDEMWHLVRNVRGVTGFVGTPTEAIPLSAEEAVAMGLETAQESTEDDGILPLPTISIDYRVGDSVRIVGTAYDGFIARVKDIDLNANCITVLVTMANQEVPVPLKPEQVESLS